MGAPRLDVDAQLDTAQIIVCCGAGGAPLACMGPVGSGNRKAGRPALRQNSSGSMPRSLKAASTNGCMSWPGIRFTISDLKYGPDPIPSARAPMNFDAVVIE